MTPLPPPNHPLPSNSTYSEVNRSSTVLAGDEFHKSATLTLLERTCLAFVSVVLGVLLGTAAYLTPSAEGVGTHQQLGLPGCTMLTVIGIRCPACGMTTSWAHTMNGDLIAGMHANFGGVLLCLSSLALVPLFLWHCISGQRWAGQRRVGQQRVGQTASIFVLTLAGISLAEWLIRLAAG